MHPEQPKLGFVSLYQRYPSFSVKESMGHRPRAVADLLLCTLLFAHPVFDTADVRRQVC